MTSLAELTPSMLDRIRHNLVGLKMPRALEALDGVVRRLEHAEIDALEAIDILLSEDLTLREKSRIKTALRMGRLATIKTIAGFDFSFQPSLDRDRILTLAQLGFIARHEVVHFLGLPGTEKIYLATALGVEAVKAGRSVYFCTLARRGINKIATARVAPLAAELFVRILLPLPGIKNAMEVTIVGLPYKALVLRVVMSTLVCAVGACSTAIKYDMQMPGDQPSAGSLPFTLAGSQITLSDAAASGAGQSPPACPTTASALDWSGCVAKLTALATPAVPKGAGVWIAAPDDFLAAEFVTTTITGTAVTGQNTLYSPITVAYKNNIPGIIGGAATGAAAGFAFGGPAAPFFAVGGALVGGIGGGGAIERVERPPLQQAASPAIADYLCTDVKVDFTSAASQKTLQKPSLTLPVVINPDATTIAPSSEQTIVSAKTVPNACFHALPNSAYLHTPSPGGQGSTAAPQVALLGDGWLYRLVADPIPPTPTQLAANPNAAPTPADNSTTPPGALEKASAFFGRKSSSKFPFTACRPVTLQLTWWQDLATYAANSSGTLPKMVTFDLVIADPTWVGEADVSHGGVLNAKPDCGVNVSLTPDATATAILNATITNAQSIDKAYQTWAATRK